MVSQKRWDAFYKAACDIFEQKGAIVIHHDLTVDDVNVYAVCADLRDLYRKGTLPQEYIDMLDSKGMLWESVTVDWYEHYLLLRDFYNEYGRTDVRNDYVVNNMRLGVWSNKQRKKFAAQQLNSSQIKLLNSLNFNWDNIVRCKSEVSRPESKTMDSWMHRFNLLQQYFDTYGNINVSKSYIAEDGTKLGLWLTNQRNRKDGLSDEQIKLLDSLNMTWYCFNTRDQWDKTFDELIGFIKENGRATTVPKDDYLHTWITKQVGYIRNGTLTKERVQKLYQSGILSLYLDITEWPFRTVSDNQTRNMLTSVSWNDMYELAKQFYEANGHLLMPKNYMCNNLPLEAWLHGQRQQYWCDVLDKDKIDKLNQIKMQWTVIEHKWAKCYISTRVFFNQYKTSRLPVDFVTDDNEYLGQWVSKQNAAMKAFNETGQCNLSPEQRALLQEIEIDGTFVAETRTSFPEQAILFYISQKFKTVYGGCKKFGFELDIYIDDVVIGIEYDGKAWHIKPENQERDLKKNVSCEKANVTLIRVREPDLPSLDSCINIHRKNLKLNSLKDVIDDIILTINKLTGKNIALCDVNFTRDMGAILDQYRGGGNSTWNKHFNVFVQYQKTTGFSVLPIDYIDETGFRLGRWLHTQIQRNGKNCGGQVPLSKQEVLKLKSLNVPLNIREYLWMTKYVEMALGVYGKSKRYVIKNDNSDLKKWIVKQYKRWINNKLNDDQINQLGTLLIKINDCQDWIVTLSDTLVFEENIRELQSHDIELNCVVGEFQENSISKDKSTKVVKVVKPRKKVPSKRDEKWFVKYNSILEYINMATLTATIPTELYNWVVEQKKLYNEHKLNEQRSSKLNEFPGGFFNVVFEKCSNKSKIKKSKENQSEVKWQKRIKTLKNYVDNPSQPDVDKSTLTWYKDQRRNVQNNKLSFQRYEELNSIMGGDFCDISLCQHVKKIYQQLHPDVMVNTISTKNINIEKWTKSLQDLAIYISTPPDSKYADKRLLAWYNRQKNQYENNKLLPKQIDLLNDVMNGKFYEISLSKYVKNKYLSLYPQQKKQSKVNMPTSKSKIIEHDDETIVLQTSQLTIFQHEIDLL